MNKRLTALITAIVMLFTCSAALADAAVFTGEGTGMGGTLTVEMTVDGGVITDLTVKTCNDTPGICERAVEQLPGEIVKYQSLAVDTVTGATVTSKGILEAAANAALAAGLDMEALTRPIEKEAAPAQDTEQTFDVVVIGAGGAGLAAAAAAGENGASVIVLEAAGIVGGSTIRSGGHMLVFDEAINASMDRNDESLKVYLDYNTEDFGEWGEMLTIAQAQIRAYLDSNQVGRFDSKELAMVDHYIKGSGVDLYGNEVTLDYALIHNAVFATDDLNDWLISGGMGIQPKMYNAHGGTPVNGAAGMVDALSTLAAQAGAEVLLGMRAEELITENGVVCGVKATDVNGGHHIFHANKGVVIATGSFSSNGAMCAQYQTFARGMFEGNGSSNPVTNDGQGLIMAEQVGAQLRDMGFMCTMTGGINDFSRSTWNKVYGTEQLMVNADAVRFASEEDKSVYNGMNAGLIHQPKGRIYLVGDSKMVDALNAVMDGLAESLVKGGAGFTADTLAEAAALADLDADALAQTVAAFNSYVDNGVDPDFGLAKFNGKVEEGPYFVAVGEAIYHLTFGGLVINTEAEVLDNAGSAIPGLYAAGDVISGFEGDVHQSGDCLTTVLYYGKVAGEQAAKR